MTCTYNGSSFHVPIPKWVRDRSSSKLGTEARVRISPGLISKPLYFNLVSIAKPYQFNRIYTTIKRYHRTCWGNVQTLGSVVVEGRVLSPHTDVVCLRYSNHTESQGDTCACQHSTNLPSTMRQISIADIVILLCVSL
jgi:hypothetical protein